MENKEVVSIFTKMARRRGQRKGYLREDGSGNWLLTYRVDTPEGRERVTVTIARSSGAGAVGKRDATRIAWEEYLSKVDTMSQRPSSALTMREFVEQRFNPDVVDKLRKGGQIHYRLQLGKHILPNIGAKSMRDLTPSLVQALLNSKLKDGLSTQSVVHIRNAISAVMRHAKRMGWFHGELPTEGVRLPPMRRKERRALTWDQVCLISGALPEPIGTLVIFLTLTGLRISEAMGLRWKWVNLTADLMVTDGEIVPPMSIAIRQSYRYGQYQDVKSPKSRRIVPIQAWFAPHLARLGSSASSEDPVFAGRSGKPLDAVHVTCRILKPIMRKLGLPWVSFHNLRVTNATLADQSGLTTTERQRILGHATTAMTELYTRADLNRVRPIMEQMVDPKKLN